MLSYTVCVCVCVCVCVLATLSLWFSGMKYTHNVVQSSPLSISKTSSLSQMIPWTARRSNQSIQNEINPEYSWKVYCWSSKTLKVKSESHSVMSDCLQPHGLYNPWNSPGQNSAVGRLSLLQGIFPTKGRPGLSTQVSRIAGRFFTSWAIREAPKGQPAALARTQTRVNS